MVERVGNKQSQGNAKGRSPHAWIAGQRKAVQEWASQVGEWASGIQGRVSVAAACGYLRNPVSIMDPSYQFQP